MKPRNFPGRKNERRKTALYTLSSALTESNDGHIENKWDLMFDYPETYHRIKVEIRTLQERIVHTNTARAIRTKKRRTGPRKLQAA